MNPGFLKQKAYLLLIFSVFLIGIGGFFYFGNLLYQQKLNKTLYANEKKYSSIAELNTLQLKAIKDKRGFQINKADYMIKSYLEYKKQSVDLARKIAIEFRGDSLKDQVDSLLLLVRKRYEDLDLQIHYINTLPELKANQKIAENFAGSRALSESWEHGFNKLQSDLHLRSINLAAKEEQLAQQNNLSFIFLLFLTVGLLTWSFFSIKRQEILKQQNDSAMRINSAVRASEREFSSAFEYASIGMALVSVNGKFMRVNSSLCRLLGYSAKELKALNFQDITHPDDLDADVDFVNRMINGSIESYTMEKRYFDKKGKVLWINLSVSMVHHADGTPKYFISQIENITDWKNAQFSLSESEVKYRSLFENSLHGKLLHEFSGTVLDANLAAINMFGYTAEELDHLLLNELLDSADSRLSDILLARNETGKAQGESTGIRKNGERFPLLLSSVLFKDKSGNDIYSTTLVDLSKQKETEKLLAQKNEELESFAATAAHDLKEPLRMIGSFMSLLKSKYAGQLDPSANKYIDFAISGSTRMNYLITDLLDYAKVGSEQVPFVEVDPELLLLDIMALNDSYITEKSAKISWTQLPVIVAQKTPVQLLFQNLLMNGLKYQAPDSVPNIQISGQELTDCWMFSVEDNGIGIPTNYHDKIFQVFSRLHSKDKYGGTGMGLATCKKIVELHGGKIWVESQEGQGSCFHFTISKNSIA
jgi:PAS domain S-box-containing protein